MHYAISRLIHKSDYKSFPQLLNRRHTQEQSIYQHFHYISHINLGLKGCTLNLLIGDANQSLCTKLVALTGSEVQ
jgi:hypothetical protein